jgi:hypothetical protein
MGGASFTDDSTGQLGKGMKEKLRARRTRASAGWEVRHSPLVLRPSMLACPCALDPPAITHFLDDHLLCSQTHPVLVPPPPSLSLYLPPTHSELAHTDLEAEKGSEIDSEPTMGGARRTESERERQWGTGPSGRSEGMRMAWVRLLSSPPFLPIQCASTNPRPCLSTHSRSILLMIPIPEILEASGAKLNASEGMLPGSTEV